MSNRSKKVVIDALGLYRLNAVDVLCCKESLDAFKANNDLAIEFGKLFKFILYLVYHIITIQCIRKICNIRNIPT